jgi:ACR3 family arsenite efflux pump ArsB
MALAFTLYRRVLGQQFEFTLPPLTLVLRLTLLVVIPMLAGVAVRIWKPRWAAAQRDLLRNLCLIGTAFLLLFVLVNRWTQVVADWRQTALVGLLFMIAALVTGLTLARMLRLSASDSITVSILFTVRNVALAGAIAVTILNRIEFAEIAVVYFLAEVPLLLGFVGTYRRWLCRQPV